jgi:glycosyltransferase involved in cell wall biosynthesis
MKVNVLLLTIDRYHLTEDFVGKALQNAGYPFDLCCTDNGSKDERVIELVNSWKPALHILNKENKGTTQALNEMIRQKPADAYVFIGNDIRMPNGWLRELVGAAKTIPDAGVIGIDWRGLQYDKVNYNGLVVKDSLNIFGTMFHTQVARNKVGEFCEEYGPYGLWDSDYALRCHYAGLKNFYLDNLMTEHMGGDVGEQSEYRKMKDASLAAARPKFDANLEKYKQGDYFKSYK